MVKLLLKTKLILPQCGEIVSQPFQFLRDQMLRTHFRWQMCNTTCQCNHMWFKSLETFVYTLEMHKTFIIICGFIHRLIADIHLHVTNFASVIGSFAISNRSSAHRTGWQRWNATMSSSKSCSSECGLLMHSTGHSAGAKHSKHFAVHVLKSFELRTNVTYALRIRFRITYRLPSAPRTATD